MAQRNYFRLPPPKPPYIFTMPRALPVSMPHDAQFETYAWGCKIEAQFKEDQRIAALPPAPPLSFGDHLYTEETK